MKTTLSMPKKELVRNNPIEQGGSRYLEEDNSGSKLLCLCGKSIKRNNIYSFNL